MALKGIVMPDETQPIEPAPTSSPENPRRPRFKWLLIFYAVVGLLALAAWKFTVDRSQASFATYYVLLPLTVLLSLIWWLFLSGVARRTRVRGVLTFVVLLGAAIGAVRIEDFEGDMKPQFAWRWSPTAEQRAADAKRIQPSADVGHLAGRELMIVEEDWPEFRNDDREGIVPHLQLNRDFAANPPQEVWRHPVGLGWSSFSIVDDLCWTQEQLFEKELVVCYELQTGKQVWVHEDETRWSESVGGDGPRATPTIHEGHAYSLGATGILNCLNALTGEKIWTRNILEDAGAKKNISWAMSASPLIVDQMVIVNPGTGAEKKTEQGKGVIAYDKHSGEILWAKGNHPASYAGVRLAELHGENQLILFDGHGVAGIAPADGTELWRFEWENMPQVNAAQPIVRGNRILISSSYNRGSALLQIGRTEGRWSVEPVWARNNFFKLKFNDGVEKDGFVYGLDESLMSCIEMETGKRQWKARSNTGFGQLILIGDILTILCENGDLVFAEATPEKWLELHRMPVLTGNTWNNPAFSRGYLLLRNGKEAVCLKLAMQ
jgi:outer membrane protein assembly factor BamB